VPKIPPPSMVRWKPTWSVVIAPRGRARGVSKVRDIERRASEVSGNQAVDNSGDNPVGLWTTVWI